MKNEKKKSMAKKMTKGYDPVNDIMAFEDGSLDEKGTKKLFQHLVNTGQAWHLQGSYGRAADMMLRSGFIKTPKTNVAKSAHSKDAYGNPLRKLRWNQ